LLHDPYVYLYVRALSISEESIALRGSGSPPARRIWTSGRGGSPWSASAG